MRGGVEGAVQQRDAADEAGASDGASPLISTVRRRVSHTAPLVYDLYPSADGTAEEIALVGEASA